MELMMDEILNLYFEGYYLNDILAAMLENKNKKKIKEKTRNKKKKSAKKKLAISKEQCIDLSLPRIDYPDYFSKLDIKEYEAVQFKRALERDLELAPGIIYQVFTPKNKILNECFVGELKEENSRYIRLEHKRGYSQTFLKSDLLSGNYLIKEA